MSNALDEHEDAITKMKVALVSAIMKEQSVVNELKAVRKKLIDDILITLPASLKDARYDDKIRINVESTARSLSTSQEYKLFAQELRTVLTDLQLDPSRDRDDYIYISKGRLIELIDANKLATLI